MGSPPHKPDLGHKQSHDPPLAKLRRFSWEMLAEMLHYWPLHLILSMRYRLDAKSVYLLPTGTLRALRVRWRSLPHTPKVRWNGSLPMRGGLSLHPKTLMTDQGKKSGFCVRLRI